jgi:hypothetical protein
VLCQQYDAASKQSCITAISSSSSADDSDCLDGSDGGSNSTQQRVRAAKVEVAVVLGKRGLLAALAKELVALREEWDQTHRQLKDWCTAVVREDAVRGLVLLGGGGYDGPAWLQGWLGHWGYVRSICHTVLAACCTVHIYACIWTGV